MATATFGWIPPEQRTPEQTQAHENIVGSMRPFQIVGGPGMGISNWNDGKRVVLWDFSRKVLGGQHIPTLRQMTGSCVGNGAWNAIMYAACVEIVKGDREKLHTIFLPYHYGRGRMHAGIRGRGEGSTGSGQADAILKDGVLSNDEDSSLPKPTGGPNALTWGADQEMKWSDGGAIADNYVQRGRKHPFRSAAPVTTYRDVRDAIMNGYPVTVASMQGFQMRQRSDRGKMWGIPSGQWAHQMSFVGVDDDQSRPGAYCLNSWGDDAHDRPLGDEPPGGFWVDAATVERMVGQRDSFAYSQFDGFPAQDLDFHLV